ncbi:hypothetical protein V8C42DRAFT_118934 [Trichoderma barbatum]
MTFPPCLVFSRAGLLSSFDVCLFLFFHFLLFLFFGWRLRLLTYNLLLLVPQLTPYEVLPLHSSRSPYIHNVSIKPAAFIPDGDKPDQSVTLPCYFFSSFLFGHRPAVTAIMGLPLLLFSDLYSATWAWPYA